MVAVCIGGGVGGAIAGPSGAQASGFAIPSIATLPVFFDHGFLVSLLSCVVGFIVSFLVTWAWRFRVDEAVEHPEDAPELATA